MNYLQKRKPSFRLQLQFGMLIFMWKWMMMSTWIWVWIHLLCFLLILTRSIDSNSVCLDACLSRYASNHTCSSSFKTQDLHGVYEVWTSSFSKVLLNSCHLNNRIFNWFSWEDIYFLILSLGMSNTTNQSTGNSERKETNISGMRLGKSMLSRRI